MTLIDYGTIQVVLLPNLTDDQKYTIIKQVVENQVFARNRTHYNQILNQCTNFVIENPDISINIKWIMSEYVYSFKVNT
jgi:hypothetical protein